MFTNSTISLQEFAGQMGLSVQRDCKFSFVGKAPTNLDRRIVPCSALKHINEALVTDGIAGIITTPELASRVPDLLGLATCETPQATAWALHEELAKRPGLQWTDFPSRVHPDADVRAGAHVAARNVEIGARTIVMPGAVICERTIVGADCLIGPGTVLGCEAFEVDGAREPQRLLAQAGGVRLGDNVEITGHSTVVRATFGGFTELAPGAKLDCHVHVAHDCRIGERTCIAAGAILSGRVMVLQDVFIGPNATISNGVTIGEGATVTLGAVVVRDVPSGERVTGHFAVPHRAWLRFIKPGA